MYDRNYTITGHMVVKNEDRWIWFSVMSVIDYLDKLIIFDTGSIDYTNKIIEGIIKDERYAAKIYYAKLGSVSSENFHKVRQKQIDMTDSDYFMVIDGDEIWYRDSINELNRILSKSRPLLVATRFINCCGDIFHYRYDFRETYCVKGIVGSITIRVYSMQIPDIRCGGIYGTEGYVDQSGVAVQDAGYSIKIMNGKYLHTSLLNRSSALNGDFSIKYRRLKLHAYWDKKFDTDYRFPEVFYMDYPQYVKSPFKKDFNLIRTLYHVVHYMKRIFKYDAFR